MSPFTLPPDAAVFYQTVYQLVARIPVGKVATYGQLARLLAYPPGIDPRVYDILSARWVGGAMANCPDNLAWHRVVNSQGRVSPRPGAQKQQELLVADGVKFKPNGAIDLRVYGWDGQ